MCYLGLNVRNCSKEWRDCCGLENYRGHSLKLKKFRCKVDLRKYFFSERIVDRWNLLDEDTVSACNLNSFKNRLANLRQKQKGFFVDT